MNVATILERPMRFSADSAPGERSAVAEVSKDLVVFAEPNGPRAENVRTLRTHIMAQHVNHGRRGLAVCAATANVGCSFIAANLAASLSQIGVKTLLVDGDLRNPSIDLLISCPTADHGLRQCLDLADANFGAYIESEVSPNLSILYAGGRAERPHDLLASKIFRDLMEFCLREFELTIVDTPPANSSSDARRISNVVGYSLIVARRDRSSFSDLRLIAEELRVDHARVIGAVLDEG